jgi:hypothetical protein
MNKYFQKLGWLIAPAFLAAFVALGCDTPRSSPVAVTSGEAGLNISTTHAVPLYKDIHSACTVDIFYTKGMVSRDILSEPYFSFVKSLNFTSLQYSGGSTADHEHVIVGETRVSGGKGDGYNMREEDAKARGESFESLLDGAGTAKFGVDFFNQYCALLKKLQIRGDVIANVQSGTLTELYWKIEQSNAERVIFGMEQSTGSNTYDFPDGITYRKKITAWIDSVKKKFPGIITVVDAAPIYKSQSRAGEWNKEIRNMPGDEARLYLWDKDLMVTGENAAENLVSINRIYAETIPSWLDEFRQQFPGKKASVWQWGLKPKTAVYNSMLGCLYIGKFYQFVIDYNKTHDNFIGYASFMSLKSLDRGDAGNGRKDKDATNHYEALKLCGLIFNGQKRVDDLAISGLKGLTGVAFDENGKYMLLLINETGTEINVPSLKVNGTAVSPKSYVVTSVSAPSLDSYAVNYATTSSSQLKVAPYSLNIVSF